LIGIEPNSGSMLILTDVRSYSGASRPITPKAERSGRSYRYGWAAALQSADPDRPGTL